MRIAVDAKIGAGNEAAGIGRQEQRSARQFFGAAEFGQGNGLSQFHLERGSCLFCDAQLGEDRRVDRSRGSTH